MNPGPPRGAQLGDRHTVIKDAQHVSLDHPGVLVAPTQHRSARPLHLVFRPRRECAARRGATTPAMPGTRELARLSDSANVPYAAPPRADPQRHRLLLDALPRATAPRLMTP